MNALPKDYVFLNYLRCHEDIGWGLDYGTLKMDGMEERAHKKYLNDYFQGYDGSSCSRGELYNADPVTGDARFCGTTASMCGVEKAGFEGDDAAMERAIQMDLMLHAYMFRRTGILVFYSGEEIGQWMDYRYKENQPKEVIRGYFNGGPMNGKLPINFKNEFTLEGKFFQD